MRNFLRGFRNAEAEEERRSNGALFGSIIIAAFVLGAMVLDWIGDLGGRGSLLDLALVVLPIALVPVGLVVGVMVFLRSRAAKYRNRDGSDEL